MLFNFMVNFFRLLHYKFRTQIAVLQAFIIKVNYKFLIKVNYK